MGLEPESLEMRSEHAGAAIGFSTHRDEKVQASVSSSFISWEQAERNMEEIGSRTFEQVKTDGRKIWNETLGRIRIESDDSDRMRTFYSCFYRSVLFPRMFYEFDEKGNPIHYSPYNGKVLPVYMYTDTGFWDTFRCLFSFVNLVYPSMGAKMQEGLLNTYLESGFFPEWASPGHRGCMVGNNSASVVAEGLIKNIIPANA